MWIKLSSSGPWSYILNGQTSQRQTQVKTQSESQKGTRADTIIKIHHPPPTLQTIQN